MQINNTAQEETPNQAKKKPRYWLLALIILVIFGVPAYFIWKVNIYGANHQVPITCTVTSARHDQVSSSGKGYSSIYDEVVFSTEECGGLYLIVENKEEAQSVVDKIQPGKKYEFMVGQSTADDTSGGRRAFSYDGPRN